MTTVDAMATSTAQRRTTWAWLLLLVTVLALAGCTAESEDEAYERKTQEDAAQRILAWDINAATNGVPEGYDDYVAYQAEREDDPTYQHIARYRSQAEREEYDKAWNIELVGVLVETEERLVQEKQSAESTGTSTRYFDWRKEHEERAELMPTTLVEAYLNHLDEVDDEQSRTDAEIIRYALKQNPTTDW